MIFRFHYTRAGDERAVTFGALSLAEAEALASCVLAPVLESLGKIKPGKVEHVPHNPLREYQIRNWTPTKNWRLDV